MHLTSFITLPLCFTRFTRMSDLSWNETWTDTTKHMQIFLIIIVSPQTLLFSLKLNLTTARGITLTTIYRTRQDRGHFKLLEQSGKVRLQATKGWYAMAKLLQWSQRRCTAPCHDLCRRCKSAEWPFDQPNCFRDDPSVRAQNLSGPATVDWRLKLLLSCCSGHWTGHLTTRPGCRLD